MLLLLLKISRFLLLFQSSHSDDTRTYCHTHGYRGENVSVYSTPTLYSATIHVHCTCTYMYVAWVGWDSVHHVSLGDCIIIVLLLQDW